jgi:hypothetical protein
MPCSFRVQLNLLPSVRTCVVRNLRSDGEDCWEFFLLLALCTHQSKPRIAVCTVTLPFVRTPVCLSVSLYMFLSRSHTLMAHSLSLTHTQHTSHITSHAHTTHYWSGLHERRVQEKGMCSRKTKTCAVACFSFMHKNKNNRL